MIMMDAEADESTLPLVPYQPAIVKQYRPMSVQRSAFSDAIILRVSPCRCRSLIVDCNRALTVDGEKDESRGCQISARRTLNAKR
jgi:hypothetical protein